MNYLDDYLFIVLLKLLCSQQLDIFMQVCSTINFPVSLEKTCYPTTRLIFLGLLLDTVNQVILLPKEKIQRGRFMIGRILEKTSKKVTIKELQQLCGFLNFLGRAVVPGRAFTRQLYHYTKSNDKLKPHHHVKINQEMRLDLEMWNLFLLQPSVLARPFLDLTLSMCATDIGMFSDATKKPETRDWRYMRFCLVV